MALAHAAEVSTRHLSWLETGRAQPSRAMVLRLARQLDLPLRERNRWLQAAGYAALFAEHSLLGTTATPALAPWRDAVQRLLDAHDPAPALALDGHWNLLACNRMARRLLSALPAELSGTPLVDDPGAPPLNLLRATLHPRGLAPFIADLPAWREHALQRLRRQIAATGDAALVALHTELSGFAPAPEHSAPSDADTEPAPVLTLGLDWPGLGRLNFITTVTVFGTPADITTAELAIETLLPADAGTAAALTKLANPSAASLNLPM